MPDDRTTRAPIAQPQEESTKVHGDKLEPVIPRGADQVPDEPRKRDERPETTPSPRDTE